MIKSSTKPDAWTLSPQMTAAPELWRGCKFFLPLWSKESSSGSVASIVKHSHEASLSGGQSVFLGSNGYVLDNDNTGLDFGQILDFGGTTGEVTVFLYYRITTFDNWTKGIHKGRDNSYGLQAEHSNTGSASLRVWTNNGNANAIGSRAVRDGDFHAAAGSYDGKILLLSVDGFDDAQTSHTGNLESAPNEDFFIGRDNSTFDRLEGEVALAAAWDRAMNMAQLQSLTADPFAMLRPAGF